MERVKYVHLATFRVDTDNLYTIQDMRRAVFTQYFTRRKQSSERHEDKARQLHVDWHDIPNSSKMVLSKAKEVNVSEITRYTIPVVD